MNMAIDFFASVGQLDLRLERRVEPTTHGNGGWTRTAAADGSRGCAKRKAHANRARIACAPCRRSIFDLALFKGSLHHAAQRLRLHILVSLAPPHHYLVRHRPACHISLTIQLLPTRPASILKCYVVSVAGFRPNDFCCRGLGSKTSQSRADSERAPSVKQLAIVHSFVL